MTQTENDLHTLLGQKIPNPIKHEIGFLEITKQQTKETVNSRVYEYFLNRKFHPEIADVFLQALLNLIKKSNNTDIYFGDYTCVSEETTEKGNRIDLLIRDNKYKTAIIIENKIYHYLNNDLNDYWNYIQSNDENKRGVLLTLYKTKVPDNGNGKYVNITHKEWIDEIQRIGLPSKIDIKKYVYLNDFFTTIDQITYNTNMNEQAEFYFKHTEQIIKAKLTYIEAINFVLNQLNILAEYFNCEAIGKDCWRNIRNENNTQKAFYTIIYDDVINSDQKKIIVIIELGKEGIAQININERPQDIIDIIKKRKLVNGENGDKKTWQHYVYKSYDVSIVDLENLSDFLKEKIDNDFKEVMEKINTIIS